MFEIQKTCADCGELKPITAFSVKDRRRGYTNKYCKPCDSKRSIKRQAGRTAERVAYNRQWLAKNPGKKSEYNNRGGKRYREKHPDYWSQYYLNNKDRRIWNSRNWRERNRDRYLQTEADRRLRKRLNLQPDELLTLVDKAVPKHFPFREDACQELLLRVLSGAVSVDDIAIEAKQVVKELWAMHGFKFQTVSLDAPMPDSYSDTFADRLVG